MAIFLYFTAIPVFAAFMNMMINRFDNTVSAAITVYLNQYAIRQYYSASYSNFCWKHSFGQSFVMTLFRVFCLNKTVHSFDIQRTVHRDIFL